jgi:hypothetical protein
MIKKNFFCKYDLIIVSPGGSAQSFIMDLINKQKPQGYKINLGDDSDNLKHLSSFENSVFNANKVKRVLYIFNSTLLSILSNFRRNWYCMQYRKISKYEDFNSSHLFATPDDLFEQVIKTNQDVSNVSAHFYNWLKYTENIYFLDVNEIDDNKLNKFLGFKLDLSLSISNELRHKYPNIPLDITLFYKNIDENIKHQIKIKNNEKFLS